MRILAHFSVYSNLPEITGFFGVLVRKMQCLCGFAPRTKLSETNTKLTDPDTHFIKLEIVLSRDGHVGSNPTICASVTLNSIRFGFSVLFCFPAFPESPFSSTAIPCGTHTQQRECAFFFFPVFRDSYHCFRSFPSGRLRVFDIVSALRCLD